MSNDVKVDIRFPDAVRLHNVGELVSALKQKVKDPEIRVETVTITVTEQVTAEVTLRHAAPDGSPFPEAQPGAVGPVGVLSGTNGLFRSQFQNGRMLTAESLRKEQAYVDARARMVARVASSGVVWGLGLRIPGSVPALGAPTATGTSVELDGPAVLEPGLALDAAGRPIAVGAERVFTFRELLRRSAAVPLEVASGGTTFQPCVCLRPATTAAVGGAEQAGAWLLVLSPEERPEGEAKVYGVRTQSPLGCVPDGWRGGYTLALARLPIDVATFRARDVWSLRGHLVAWLFDAWEQDLSRSWAGPEATTDPSGGPPTPSSVPLALVQIAPDGGVLFCDRWAPRRPVVETASAEEDARVHGRETGSRALARSRQFQAMLLESLGVQPMDFTGTGDLYSRGFRHLPPAGTLPVHGAVLTGADPIERARAALRAARAYFAGSNVVLGEEIAVHDDYLLGSLEAAARLDPIRLRQDPGVPTDGSALDPVLDQPSLRSFGTALLARRVTLEQLVSGEIELVRLIVGLQGGSAIEPRPFVAFVRHVPSIALGLPPPPVAAPPPAESEAPLAIHITGPAEGSTLWKGTRVRFTWQTTGGSGALRHAATLRSRVRTTTFGGVQTWDWEERLTLDPSGQSATATIPTGWLIEPVRLHVTVEDGRASPVEATPRSWTAVPRTIRLVEPDLGGRVAHHNMPVPIAWELSEGWGSALRLSGTATIRWPRMELRPPSGPTQPGVLQSANWVKVGEDSAVVTFPLAASGRSGRESWPLHLELARLGVREGSVTLRVDASDEHGEGGASATASFAFAVIPV